MSHLMDQFKDEGGRSHLVDPFRDDGGGIPLDGPI